MFHFIGKGIPTMLITEIKLSESIVTGHSFLLMRPICLESILIKQFIIWFSIYKNTTQYAEISILIGLIVKFLIINLKTALFNLYAFVCNMFPSKGSRTSDQQWLPHRG